MAIFEFHIHQAVDVDRLLKEIKLINLKLDKMATKQEIQTALDDVNGALDNIGNDIIRLTEQIQNGGLSTSEEDDVLAQLKAIGERAKQIAGQTPETEEPQP